MGSIEAQTEFLDDLIIDIPTAAEFFGKVLDSVVSAEGVGLSFLAKLSSLKSQENGSKVVALVLKALVKRVGETEAAVACEAAGGLTSFLPEEFGNAEKLTAWLGRNVIPLSCSFFSFVFRFLFFSYRLFET